MLGDEDQIKGNTDICQTQFEGISGNAAPVPLETGVNDQLHDGQDAPGEVKQDLHDTPSLGRFALVVEEDLWDVLDERGDELDIAQRVKLGSR